MGPRVSVVVPTYQNSVTIGATIDAILAQTYPDFELVVADHSSTDGTWELLQRYLDDPRVRLLRTPAGGGAPANWNAVTAQATGELIKLVCGDDLLRPNALAEQVAALDAHPQAVLVASRRDVIDDVGRILVAGRGLQGLPAGVVPGGLAIRRTVRAGTNIFGEPMCVLIRRAALVEAGGWDGSRPYLIDQASYAAVLRHGPMVALPTTLAAFRVSHSQWSVKLARQQAADARAFHRAAAAANPGLLTRTDLLLGDVRASVLALARRAVYLLLRIRSSRAAGRAG